mmetsp:Transcript_1040/g.1653  ORF Transcript_1040/g.1653 Transcript_1040/m.1653 type:complete len:86 (-) Transcript_1040:13-270(-)
MSQPGRESGLTHGAASCFSTCTVKIWLVPYPSKPWCVQQLERWCLPVDSTKQAHVLSSIAVLQPTAFKDLPAAHHTASITVQPAQ